MTWETYYERFYDWAESTQVSYMSKLESFGPSVEICEIAQEFFEEKNASRLVKKALAAGVVFSAEEVLELEGVVADELMPELIRSASTPFSADDLDNLSYYLDAADLERTAEKSGIALDEDGNVALAVQEEKGDPEAVIDVLDDLESMLDVMKRQCVMRRPKPGLGALLLAWLFASGRSGKKDRHNRPHSGRCDGDCANCPPHYGYRYGRWYYGRHHHYGCQFGGNRGGGGLD